MRYIIITAKHHDGFAMDASKVSAFNIHDATPFKRDPLAELNAAAQKRGVRLGFYYSQAQDWTAPGGGAIGGHWDKAQDGDFAHYFETKAIPQVRELLSNYSPVPAVLWFDTPEKMTPELAAKWSSCSTRTRSSSGTTGSAAAMRATPRRRSNRFPPEASPAATGKRA